MDEDDPYKEIEEISNDRKLFKEVNFNEVYKFSLKDYSKKEKFTPNQNEVNDCLNNLTEEPIIAFYAASKLVEFIFNSPSILYEISGEQFLPIFGMLQELAFQRTGLTFLSMAFEACDLIPSFDVFIENDIISLLIQILQETNELEIYWNILTCISCAAKSNNINTQMYLLNSGIINNLLEIEHEEEEFKERKMKTINSLINAKWLENCFDPVSYFYEFVLSKFHNDNDFDVFYGVYFLKNCFKINPDIIQTFINEKGNKERLLLCLENERTELRNNAIEILSLICSQNNEIIEQFMDIDIISHIFDLIDASSAENIQELFNILFKVFEFVPQDLQQFIIDKIINYFNQSNIFDLNSDSKTIILQLIDEIVKNASPHLVDELIRDHIKEFLESMIETEALENVFIVCRIFLILYEKIVKIKSEIPEQQILSNESLDIISDVEENIDNENSPDFDKKQILSKLLSYYTKNDQNESK